MSIGTIEITFMIISWSTVALLYFVAHLVTRKTNQKLPRMLLLLYGLPACHTLACLLTPPELISSLLLPLPCIALYILVSVCALLLSRHVSKRSTEHPA